MEREAREPRIPRHMEPILEGVLVGQTNCEVAVAALGVSKYELGILLRALIRKRAREQWDYTD